MATYTTRPMTAEVRARLSSKRPVSSPFSASWRSTESLLLREIEHLGAREFVLQIDVTESDMRLDGRLRANARPASDAVAVSVEARGKGDLLFVCDRFIGWQQNVRAIALGLEALRRVDRYGITKANEQYRGWQALPPGTPMPAAQMTVDGAERLLRTHGGSSDPNESWNDMWRRAARRCHPDVGGDADVFRRLTEARDLLTNGGGS